MREASARVCVCVWCIDRNELLSVLMMQICVVLDTFFFAQSQVSQAQQHVVPIIFHSK